MIAMFKRFFTRRNAAKIYTQPVGEVFPWKAGMVLKAVDPVVFAFPRALLGDNEVIGSVFQVDDDAQVGFQDDNNWIVIRLRPGMKVSVTKSCQAVVIAEHPGDTKPKQLEIVAGI
jgi:hypothetical protein